jgi:hypothetical protein
MSKGKAVKRNEVHPRKGGRNIRYASTMQSPRHADVVRDASHHKSIYFASNLAQLFGE